ncbi:ABC transporter permease [Paenibacillus protaetiae]|uniref:ABC transporter permease n=2 Tax=Paenibacillus protaetiae TaxID=2509456 RepID=A0A4P6FD41_9BACL|nr:ABC transporter permease [Paenibacillus protaetiae]
MISLSKPSKYLFIGKITLRNQLAYIADFLVRSLFLILILYIFMQLWQTTFHGEGSSSISGYTFRQIMWYLVVTESMVIATPSLCTRIEGEVKSGDVAFKLIRPVSFLAFHYVEYMSEVALRFVINLALGSAVGLLLVGSPPVSAGLLWLPLIAFGGFTVNFMLGMLVALSAFWVEETRGLEFVYNKILFTVGGMLMPLELFPEKLRQIGHFLPFQTIVYFPAKTAVAMQPDALAGMLGLQLLWVALIGTAVWLVYRKGVRKLNVNGG